MPVAFLTLEFSQPAPAMPSPAPSIRIVTARGLNEKEKAAFAEKHTIHMRQAYTNTHNKGTPLEDMLKDVPAMLSTLETLGYNVVSSTSNSIFKMRDLPEPVIRDCYVWTLSKPLDTQPATPPPVAAPVVEEKKIEANPAEEPEN